MEFEKNRIPEEVRTTAEILENAHFKAYLVGGCVRDLLLKKTPKDWDIATDATPEQIQQVFTHSFYDNKFGTVGVVYDSTEDPTIKVIEVTPFRVESGYSDSRRPDAVSFSSEIKDDLKRRDFTINAMAFRLSNNEFIDFFNGAEDLERGIVRAVGDPKERFEEDGLRVLRAIRIAAELGFAIEANTLVALRHSSSVLGKIAKERIRDEFVRIIMSERPMDAMFLMKRVGMLPYISAELDRSDGIEQNKSHKYDVFEHIVRSLQHAAEKGFSLEIRLAALFHDIGKPETRRFSQETSDYTFYGHEVIGARITKKVLKQLRFSSQIIEKVVLLVRWHMFFSDPDQITLSAVRRIIRHVGRENIWDLLDIRICDRIGSGRPKEQPFRFRKYKAMVEEALRDPISVGMLNINGTRIIEVTREKPGPRIGHMLHAILEEVIEDPSKNEVSFLEKRVQELSIMEDNDLAVLGNKGRERKDEMEEVELDNIKRKYGVL